MASGPTTTGKRQTMSYDVKVDRRLQGQDITSPTVTVRSDADESACGLTGMTADNRYLFFVRASGDTPAREQLQRHRPCHQRPHPAPGRAPRPGHHAGPADTGRSRTFESVDGAEPASLTRMAAPGAAMLLVGLLGLMVFGALGRSRRT